MTQFTITLTSGSKIEPTKDQSKRIAEILFGMAPTVTPVVAPLQKRPYRRGVKQERWTPEQDQKLREMVNLRHGRRIMSKDLREIAFSLGRKFKSTSARYYALYYKKHSAGEYV